jgi:hypothetical protein
MKTILLVLALLRTADGFAMTDADALAKAKLWYGIQAKIAKEHVALSYETKWFYKVGCAVTSNPLAFIVSGKGDSWEIAFAEAAGKPVLTGTVQVVASGSTTSTTVDTFECSIAPPALALERTLAATRQKK